MASALRPRIAILMEFPTALGGERSLLANTNELQKRFDLCVIAPEGGSLAHELAGVDITHVPFHFRDSDGTRREDADLLAELNTILNDQKIDLLHVNSLTLARFAGRNRSKLKLPVTGHVRDIMRLSKKGISDIGKLDRLIAVSQAAAQSLIEQGLDESSLSVLHNGIDVEQFEQPASFNLREELHLPSDCLLSVTIGQIGLRKGHDVLFEALAGLARDYPDWHFLILGERFSEKTESREFVSTLEEQAQSGGFEQRLHWMGYVNEVPSVLVQADLLIHPARQEPFGRVLLEAAAAGVPILATDAGGTTEMLSHDQTAWLVPANSADALAQGCNRLMSDAGLRQRLGQAAKQHIASQFPCEKAAAGLAQIWSESLTS
ncbi:glycosyltransferase family 4 protein [Rubinisphaera sp. JC750]|uniref:glycosyltransferase family 4 protein n=1 Tax=Rubinisphaera sp. JC750 TaxID=2898658 RepID=UPI001F4498EF|nr:glycosyltransferase family 4 protein [Rubinisphaera sp. JC750]